MKPHFMVSECDGGLYRTDLPGLPLIRANYKYHHNTIASVADLKATL